MAYDPQKTRNRPAPAADRRAPVDAFLDAMSELSDDTSFDDWMTHVIEASVAIDVGERAEGASLEVVPQPQCVAHLVPGHQFQPLHHQLFLVGLGEGRVASHRQCRGSQRRLAGVAIKQGAGPAGPPGPAGPAGRSLWPSGRRAAPWAGRALHTPLSHSGPRAGRCCSAAAQHKR
jgi:hypothetical protein